MKRLFLFFASLFIRNSDLVEDPKVRARYGMLEGWLSIIGNTILFGVKLWAGLLVHSTALIADAIHTLSDSATSVVVIFGFKMAQKPSDKEHPFGHGRVESIATLIIAVLLFVAGLELLKSSIHAIQNPCEVAASIPVILIITGTILIKQLMARFSFYIGELIDSAALKADGLHHQSDALSTVLVLAGLAASLYGYKSVDGIMGCLVSLFIFWSAWEIMKEAIDPLIGGPPSPELIRVIEKLCEAKPGVLGVHDIMAHTYGQFRVISLHIEVCYKENALTLHRIAEEIEEEISQRTRGMVVVHIDPVNRDHPDYPRIQTTLRQIVKTHDKTESFHDLRIVGDEITTSTAIFDLVIDESVPESENTRIISEITQDFKIFFPMTRVVVKVSPKCSFNP
jgi:cation diffusion facilitator family transporter